MSVGDLFAFFRHFRCFLAVSRLRAVSARDSLLPGSGFAIVTIIALSNFEQERNSVNLFSTDPQTNTWLAKRKNRQRSIRAHIGTGHNHVHA